LILFGSMLLWVASFAGCTRDTETHIDRGDKPNLDALAARGALFENVHAQYHKRRGSVPQYMTGRYFPVPGFIGFWRESWRKHPLEECYIGEILTANGYQSVMFTAHGFFGQGSRIHSSFDEVKPGAEERPNDLEMLNALVGSWLKSRGSGPFFLYIHAMDTHFPHQLPPHYLPHKLNQI